MSAWRAVPGGVCLGLRVTPKAGADRIEGLETLADGRCVLRVRVAAVPDRGQANAAVLALVAKALGLPRRALRLDRGATGRLKIVHVAGEAAVLGPLIDALGTPKPREIRETRRN